MKSAYKISIPEPCHQNWQQMSPVEKGRYCGSCQKKVHDFTLSSDREILEKMTSNTNLCGRFNNSQLDRELHVAETKSPLWLAVASGILGSMVIGGTNAYSQAKQGEVVQTDARPTRIVLGKPATPKTITVSGKVVDPSREAVPGANIMVKSSQLHTQTDIDGNFTIQATPLDTLEISFVGFDQRGIPVSEIAKNQTIVLPEGNITLGVIVSAKKPNVFRRMYFNIRNKLR